jgi:hypothetical protein
VTTEALHTRLRLVHPPAPVVRADNAAPRPSRARVEDVASANRASAALPVEQARDIFASRVAESLEGGRSAILRPERRERLVALATRMGIRAFDAHLVIALTQDAARRGEVDTKSNTWTARPEKRERPLPLVAIAIGVACGVALAMFGIAAVMGG